ncbi:hypothetical protein DPMN_005304 [Dreissena polymorpha]|uniref:Uncharacterized protein n=1 Tax=Dreissena polymorpha TaxID=45954 RepID=A0A9D4MRY0_DREPO|nr:hypothetical protein DPMN_005304 [Dreissena polymorpha]
MIQKATWCHQTYRRRTRSTKCALWGSFVALFSMYASSEEQSLLRIIISIVVARWKLKLNKS